MGQFQTEMLVKLLADCEAWITNGQYRLFEQRGEYHIAKRHNVSWKVQHSFSDLVIALSKYIELVTDDDATTQDLIMQLTD